MIKDELLKQLINNSADASQVASIYEELMLNGIEAVQVNNGRSKEENCSQVCFLLVKKYIAWNDYIHANNIMQLCKALFSFNEKRKKPLWFVRYEIIIYGRRTPLFFINNPQCLFEKILYILNESKRKDTVDKLLAALKSLFDYYAVNFLDKGINAFEREEFTRAVESEFKTKYNESYSNKLPVDIQKVIKEFIDFIEKPEVFAKPGIANEEVKIWDEEDDESIIAEHDKVKAEDFDDDSLSKIKGKKIKFIGGIKKSVKEKLLFWGKRFEFSIDFWDDYEKITNRDFTSLRYSRQVDAIIAGPMPHSIKGMGDYSSGLEMLKSESGYPPVFECLSSELLKVTTTSVWKALNEINNHFKQQ